MNSMKALIFHGTMGSPQGNWFPWLQDLLIEKGWDTQTPSFPTPENQSLDSWIKAVTDIDGSQDTDILFGHSLGATLALHLLEKNIINPKKVFLISSLIQEINIPEYDSLNYSFYKDGFQWDSIKENGAEITILHGDNDPYVPLDHAEFLSKSLDAPLKVIKNGGHLNTESNYTEFPYLLDCLNE